MLSPVRLAALPSITLTKGDHPSFDQGACAMELVAFLAGEPHSSAPECACPVIAEILRSWNDDLPGPDRNRLLKPLLPRVAGSRSSPEVMAIRAWMVIDWLIRTWTPAWLHAAGWEEEAEAISRLRGLTNATTAMHPYSYFEELHGLFHDEWKYAIRPRLHEAVLRRAFTLTGWSAPEEVFMEVMLEEPEVFFAGEHGVELWWPPLIRMATSIGWDCALTKVGEAAQGAASPRNAIQEAAMPTAIALQLSFAALLERMLETR